jgi:hypothetical protein
MILTGCAPAISMKKQTLVLFGKHAIKQPRGNASLERLNTQGLPIFTNARLVVISATLIWSNGFQEKAASAAVPKEEATCYHAPL